MRFEFNGTFPIADIEAVSSALLGLLQEHGLQNVSDLSISFLGWTEDSRSQIVDESECVQAVYIDWEVLSDRERGAPLRLPDGIKIRDRPKDLEWNPLAIWAGHDD